MKYNPEKQRIEIEATHPYFYLARRQSYLEGKLEQCPHSKQEMFVFPIKKIKNFITYLSEHNESSDEFLLFVCELLLLQIKHEKKRAQKEITELEALLAESKFLILADRINHTLVDVPTEKSIKITLFSDPYDTYIELIKQFVKNKKNQAEVIRDHVTENALIKAENKPTEKAQEKKIGNAISNFFTSMFKKSKKSVVDEKNFKQPTTPTNLPKKKKITFIDFDAYKTDITRSLSPEFIDFLRKNKNDFIDSGSPFFDFKYALIRSRNGNEWFVVENGVIGKGGFGTVTQSKLKIKLDAGHAELVPVDKIVKTQILSQESSEEEQFEAACHEANRLLEHNVIVDAVVKESKKIYLVMDDCGMSLDKLLPLQPSQQYNFEYRLEIMSRICNELLSLKNKETVHRDLKPANICYKALGNGKFNLILIDFGLAKKVIAIKEDDDISGTLLFMAPELLAGDNASYASDAYVLAALFIQLLGGTAVFKYKELAKNYQELADAAYCSDGIFEGYDRNKNIDNVLLDDIKNLINALQNPNPACRPTIEFVAKFLLAIDHRKNIYETGLIELEKKSEELTTLYNQIGLIDKSLNEKINDFALKQKRLIFDTINDFSKSTDNKESHSTIVDNLINKSEFLTRYSSYDPFPCFRIIQKEIAFTKIALENFMTNCAKIDKHFSNTEKFSTTNSSGIKKMQKILTSNTLSSLEKMKKIRIIALEKTKSDTVFSRLCLKYNRSGKFFGKGRHVNVHALYEKIAMVNSTQTDIFANHQLQEIDDYLSRNQFLHLRK